MKAYLPLLFCSVLAISCSKNEQPKCSDDIVKSSLKELIVESGYNDIKEIAFEGITTIDKNEELFNCKCTAKVNLTRIDTNIVGTEYKETHPVTYTVQLTDDKESVNVSIVE
jgi:hypothetical protein